MKDNKALNHAGTGEIELCSRPAKSISEMSSRPLPRFAHSAVTVTSSSGGKPSTVSFQCLPWRPNTEGHLLWECADSFFTFTAAC